MDTSVADMLLKLGEDERKLERQRMLQALLADRFKLRLRRETKELPIFAAILGKVLVIVYVGDTFRKLG